MRALLRRAACIVMEPVCAPASPWSFQLFSAAAPRPSIAELRLPAWHPILTSSSPARRNWADTSTQLVTARYRDRTFVFEGLLSASPERLQLVALDSFGRRALSIVWDGDRVSFEPAPCLPDALKPENILADVVIVYWPEEAVRRGLAGTEAVLRADPRERSISMRGSDTITVTYGPPNGETWVESAKYRNIAFGYELDLRSVAVKQ